MEQWKDIPGYEGRYQVSDFGNVRSVDRHVRLSTLQGATQRLARGKTLRSAPNASGHLSVVLGRGNTRNVHALVALTFLGPRPDKHEVLHIDSNPANNALTNLRYGTRGENLAMDYAIGVRKVHPNFIGARWRA